MNEMSIITQSAEAKGRDQDDLEQMLAYLNLFQDEYLALEQLQEEIVKDGRLTAKLRRIKVFAEDKGSGMQIGQFLLRKYKNLIRCFIFHEDVTLQDYSLLFDIIQATCQQSPNFTNLIKMLQQTTLKMKSRQPHNLAHIYLQVLYILLRFKLSKKESRQAQAKKLKDCCFKDILQILPQFIIKIIMKKGINIDNSLYFLKEMIGQTRYMKLTGRKQKDSSITNSKAITCATVTQSQTGQQQKVTNALESSIITNSQRVQAKISNCRQELEEPKLQDFLSATQSENIFSQSIKDWILSASIKQIKDMHESQKALPKLLRIAFKQPQLIQIVFQKALYLMETDKFTQEMRKILQENQFNPQLQVVKKAIIKQLKKYCGKDRYLHYWSKISVENKK